MTAPARLCALCRTGRVVDPIDFGLQAVCNRFLPTPLGEEYRHRLVIGRCAACGLIQIPEPVPASEMSCRFDWVVYREPEDHLDDLARRIGELPGLTAQSVICGLSAVDDSLLKRLADRGLRRQWRLDLARDLGADILPPGVEVIQERLRADMAASLTARRGKPDVVVGRYVVEHAHDVRRFLDALKALVKPGGYVVVEVPDCQPALDNFDYSAVWEEHVLYFTEPVLRRTLARGGFSLMDFESYPYRLQNALVAIAREGGTPAALPADGSLDDERARWKEWTRHLDRKRHSTQTFLREHRERKGGIAMYGAAQRGCSFVNLLELSDHLDLVVDDNVRKHGFFMPGSRLPICPPSALQEGDRSLCLLAARPESQDAVMRTHKAFLDRAGTFLSIYPDGPSQLPV